MKSGENTQNANSESNWKKSIVVYLHDLIYMLMAVLPLNHPLMGATAFPVEQLAEERLIAMKEDADYEIGRFLDALPVRPKPLYQVSSDHTILSMVESGLGVSIMHSLGARADRYQVAWKPFDRHQYRDIGIATAKGARLSGAARLFVEHVCRQLGQR